jgi:molybdate transport system permease protein
MSDLWDPLLLSLRIASAAVALGALLAVPLALLMSRRRFVGKSLLEGLIVVPMVMPPTVAGYIIIMLFGTNGWIGHWLYRAFSYSIIFRFEGAVLAAMIVAVPMLYLPTKAGFAGVERELEDSARVMGANRLQVFWHVSLPMARGGIYSGLLLGFARALGEFGATMMVFGWQANKLTLPISIYADYEQGDLQHAAAAVMALGAISLALTVAYNRSGVSIQE